MATDYFQLNMTVTKDLLISLCLLIIHVYDILFLFLQGMKSVIWATNPQIIQSDTL